jgi:hypothetical protein
MGKEFFKRPIHAGGLEVTAGSIGSSELASDCVTAAKLNGTYLAVANASTAMSGSGVFLCNNSTSTTAGFTATYQLATPSGGEEVTLFCTSFSTSTGTDNVKVKASSTGAVTYDGTNYVLTLDAAGEGARIQAVSTTRWVIISEFPLAAAVSTGPSWGTS